MDHKGLDPTAGPVGFLQNSSFPGFNIKVGPTLALVSDAPQKGLCDLWYHLYTFLATIFNPEGCDQIGSLQFHVWTKTVWKHSAKISFSKQDIVTGLKNGHTILSLKEICERRK